MTEPDLPSDVPPGPSDLTTLVEVLDHYRDAGFVGQFEPLDGPAIRCASCGVASPATEFAMHSVRRLEGASDPDDMVAAVAIVCPRCGTRGTIVLGFGPAADDQDTDVLAALRDRRHDTEMPADAAPGETTSS
jgi:hypothetical protein